MLTALLTDADAVGNLAWRVSADSSSMRVHQHSATAARSISSAPSHTGGAVESQEALDPWG